MTGINFLSHSLISHFKNIPNRKYNSYDIKKVYKNKFVYILNSCTGNIIGERETAALAIH